MKMSEAEWSKRLAFVPRASDPFLKIQTLVALYAAVEAGSFPDDSGGVEHLKRLEAACRAAGATLENVKAVARQQAER